MSIQIKDNVDELDLSNKSLIVQTNFLSLCKFKNILILNLSDSELTCLPKEINMLNKLVVLTCENNSITNIELHNPNLTALHCYNNKLTTFPIIPPSVLCLHIGQNNIKDIPYKKIEEQNLVVFLYSDNPFADYSKNKNLFILECKRQKFLIDLYNCDDEVILFQPEIKQILKNYENKKISFFALKSIEETIYEEYYLCEFIYKIKRN